MKWVLRVGGGILGLVLVLLGVAGGHWFISSQWGWRDLPRASSPSQSQLYDDRFEAAGEAAIIALSHMRETHGVPGATAAVSLDGELVWAGAVGWADLDAETPMTIDSILRIGSTSKPMTATVLARLVDASVLDFGDAVAEHAHPVNPQWGPLRLDRLMSHTAGLPGYEANTDLFGLIETMRMRTPFASVEESLHLFDTSRLLYAQGDAFHYSSFDVNLAAWVGVQASETSFPDLLRQTIHQPLDLETPLPGDFGSDHFDEVRYYETRNGDQARLWAPTDVSQRWAGGGLVARSRDLVVVAGAWLDDDFIAPETRDRSWTPMPLNNGDVNEQSYAFGWRIGQSSTRFGDHEALQIVHHGGVSRGAMSWLVVYPDQGLAVAININTRTPQFSDFSGVEREITPLFAAAAGRPID